MLVRLDPIELACKAVCESSSHGDGTDARVPLAEAMAVKASQALPSTSAMPQVLYVYAYSELLKGGTDVAN